MIVEQAYNKWAAQYDTNKNKTRDLEAIAFRKTLASIGFNNCLEIGCGTGKNTKFLVEYCKAITAVDFSTKMLSIAKQQIKSSNVNFVKADILNNWIFATTTYDLISFSLVLEHINDINSIIKKAATLLNKNGYIYIGEFHPFKQYQGSKARFEDENGKHILECYNHNISDFTNAAAQNNLSILKVEEFFDEDNKDMPRILVLLLQNKK
jgi:ubiquinone/menaquinone biosynthesis C-methylase UbiE